MPDDPTTTGPKFDPAELAAGLRHLMGAKVTEHSPFTLNFQGDLVFIVEDGYLTIRLEIEGEGSDERVASEARMPLSIFVGSELLNAVLRGLKYNFMETLRQSLTAEAILHLRDVTAAVITLMEIEDIPREKIIRDHVEETTKRLGVNLAALPDRPRGGGWTKIALRDVVARAATRLCLQGVSGRALNLDAVNDELRDAFGEAAPQSGEALRKQLDERGLSWRQIKRSAESYCRHVKAEAERQAASPVSGEVPSPENGGD